MDKREFISALAQAAQERRRDTDHRRFIRWTRRITTLRLEFEDMAEQLTEQIPEFSLKVHGYIGVDLEKYRNLARRRRAEKTWLFGVNFKYAQAQLRFVLWAATHLERPSDPTSDLDIEPVVLISMEEQQYEVVPRPKPFYRSLDELGEELLTLREVVIRDGGFMRRRYNPVTNGDEWDDNVSPSIIARDFINEVVRKLGLV